MRQRRSLETDEQRNDRFELHLQNRRQAAATEDEAMDAMIKRSIAVHGP